MLVRVIYCRRISGTSNGIVLDASGGVRYTVPVSEGLYLRGV